MATGTLGSSARDYHTRQTVYLSAALTPALLGTSSSFKIGTVPAGAAILRANTATSVAFNAGSANAISLGTASSGTQLASGAAGPGTVGSVPIALTTGSSQIAAADTDIWVTGAFTGAAATTGASVVFVEFLIP